MFVPNSRKFKQRYNQRYRRVWHFSPAKHNTFGFPAWPCRRSILLALECLKVGLLAAIIFISMYEKPNWQNWANWFQLISTDFNFQIQFSVGLWYVAKVIAAQGSSKLFTSVLFWTIMANLRYPLVGEYLFPSKWQENISPHSRQLIDSSFSKINLRNKHSMASFEHSQPFKRVLELKAACAAAASANIHKTQMWLILIAISIGKHQTTSNIFCKHQDQWEFQDALYRPYIW